MLTKLAPLFLSTGCVVTLTLSSANSAQAAAAFSFDVLPDSGPLAGSTFSGEVEFDDSSLTGTGDETTSLSSFSFDFEGSSFTLADDPSAFAQFFDGEFLGVEYTTTDFQLLSGIDFFDPTFSSIDAAFFSYDLTSGAGFGDVVYMDAPITPTPTPVPDPSMVSGLIAVGFATLRKRQLK